MDFVLLDCEDDCCVVAIKDYKIEFIPSSVIVGVFMALTWDSILSCSSKAFLFRFPTLSCLFVSSSLRFFA